ncbi:uncharacterized protein G2W53_041270 [Senna tora]|uniref:Uncharacterized protein n=1 Tax=Senna tora TaxID=362788 RepID=A0A834W2R1_9FABA|nr:uncharacterized protein G2W53_041270 [Senna tora]
MASESNTRRFGVSAQTITKHETFVEWDGWSPLRISWSSIRAVAHLVSQVECQGRLLWDAPPIPGDVTCLKFLACRVISLLLQLID